MIRFLLLILLLYLLGRLLFGPPISWRFFQSILGPKGGGRRIRHPEAEEMVACASCGTFVSRREAEEKDGRFYCKPTCRNAPSAS